MGAECCTASSNNKNDQILAQKTEYSLDEQPPNEQAKKQIQFKKQQQTTLKTTFYGSAGVACSKTMTAQKNSKIQTVIQDYKGKILNNNQLQNIKQEACEDQMTRKEPSFGTKAKEEKKPQLSTAQIIDQQANSYMEGIANKLKEVDKIH